jgi:pyruvate-formate lyase-activating enzyme
MPLKSPDEPFEEYRDRAIDSVSPSFCGAKWYNATVWLGSGTTASCHHPPAHKIPLEELEESYKALHNTKYKKLVREQMLRGERPAECEYCWKIEDLGKDKISDRVYKSIIYSDQALQECKTVFGSKMDVDLKTMEIAFDANCNFACSYCNPSFSTTWMKDVRSNGPYQNLVSDGAGAFQQDGHWAQPYGVKNENNPYTKAFWKWWENELQHSLSELRVTGGEATMSQDFWKLMDWWENNKECEVRLAVNSNLGAKQDLIERLCASTHHFKHFDLYTSNESFGKSAEYIRDGLVWKQWWKNVNLMLDKGNVREMHCMMTINSLCLFSLTKFMDQILKLRQKHKRKVMLMSFNILRFPSFMSIATLPKDVRMELARELETWLANQIEGKQLEEILLNRMEVDGLRRTIAYIKEVDVGHRYTSSLETRERDFKSFYQQYDKRRGKDFLKTFPKLRKWWEKIPETNLKALTEFIEGDSTKGWAHVDELVERANKEGWILDPAMENPGGQGYKEPEKGVVIKDKKRSIFGQ